MPCCSALDAPQLNALYANPLTATEGAPATSATAESTSETLAGPAKCTCKNGTGNVCTEPPSTGPCPPNLCHAGGHWHARPLCPVHDYRPFGLDLTADTMQAQKALVQQVLPALKAAVKTLQALEATGQLTPEEEDWLKKLAKSEQQ